MSSETDPTTGELRLRGRSPALTPEAMQQQVLAYAQDLRVALERSRATAEELAHTHVQTVAALAAAVDVRDEVTGGHVYRVANYGAILAEEMAPELRDDPQLIFGFLLHDIGKLGVPDAVLMKQGPLDPDERRVMRSHVEFGIRFVKGVSFLRPALNIIATHHEAWDGGGYPRGLKGDEIPLGARMFIICDAFDAMVHDRPYRQGMSIDRAFDILREEAGSQFDPDVVRAFTGIADRLLEVPDRPAVPDVRLATKRQAAAASVTGSVVIDSIDQPLVVVGTDGVVTEANNGFLELFGLMAPPVGMTLAELVRRAQGPVARSTDLRRQLRMLEQDLFEGRREGTVTLRTADGDRHLAWYSNLIRADGASVSGRMVVFNDLQNAAVIPGDEFASAVQRDLRRAAPDLRTALELLDDPRPDDPSWVERAEAVRAGMSRLEGLLGRLEDGARQAAEDGEDWSGLTD